MQNSQPIVSPQSCNPIIPTRFRNRLIDQVWIKRAKYEREKKQRDLIVQIEAKRDRILGGRDAYVSELDQSELTEVGDGSVGGFNRDDELHEGHLLRSEVTHGRKPIEELHLSSNGSKSEEREKEEGDGGWGGSASPRSSFSDLMRGSSSSLSRYSISQLPWESGA